MSPIRLHLPVDVRAAIWRHLLPHADAPEDAAFIFARASSQDGVQRLEHVEWSAVPPEGFASRSAYHLELSDEARAAVIKHAHDLGAAIVEFHSHRSDWPAQFSPSDWAGFEEFVPHVRWRLKGRPYGAVVVTASGFDGLVWLDNSDAPVRMDSIVAGDQLLRPTGLSPLTRHGYEFRGK